MARIPKGSVYRLDPHTLRGNAYSLPVVVRGRGGKKNADSASVHRDWNRIARNCVISSNDDILETENDIEE